MRLILWDVVLIVRRYRVRQFTALFAIPDGVYSARHDAFLARTRRPRYDRLDW